MDTNNDGIIGGGFKQGSDGKLRLNGKMVDKATTEAVLSGEILVGFDIKKLRAAKPKTSKPKGGKTILEQLNEISPAIGLLKVGMTARVAIPKGPVMRKTKGGVMKELDPKRSFAMQVVTKLNSITTEGAEWAGRVFDSGADDAGDFFFITRVADTDSPHKRAPRSGANGKTPKTPGGSNSLREALGAAQAHLGEGQAPATSGEQQAADAMAEGQTVEIGKTATPKVLEPAEVVS